MIFRALSLTSLTCSFAQILNFFVVLRTILLYEIICDIVEFLGKGEIQVNRHDKQHDKNFSFHSLFIIIVHYSSLFGTSLNSLYGMLLKRIRMIQVCFQWSSRWTLRRISPIKRRVRSARMWRENSQKITPAPYSQPDYLDDLGVSASNLQSRSFSVQQSIEDQILYWLLPFPFWSFLPSSFHAGFVGLLLRACWRFSNCPSCWLRMVTQRAEAAAETLTATAGAF